MMLRLRALLFTLIFMFAFAVSASAVSLKDYGVSADFDEDLTVITYDNANDNSDYLEKIGYTVSSLRSFFTKNNVILLASNEQNTFQVQIMCSETDFSKQVGNISNLDEESLSEISKSVAGENSVTVDINKQKYICASSSETDDNGTYRCMQYITFVNSKMYVISFYETGDIDQTYINRCMSNIKIKNSSASVFSNAKSVIIIVIISVLIIGLLIILLLIIIKFIRERKDFILQGDEKIKRRKL